MREFSRVIITDKGADFLKRGHVWVYADEITEVCGDSKKDKYMGSGFYNDHSKIRVRIVSKNANDRFDEAFWERKLRWAIEYRKTVMGEEDFSACRLIFGEADAFPGFTVDRFGNILVTQVLSLGIEKDNTIVLQAEGVDEVEAIEGLSQLLIDGFND